MSTTLEQDPRDLPSAFDALGLGIYCLNREGHFTYMNPAGAELLGWRPEELLGEHAHDLIHHSRPDGSPVTREACPFYQDVRRGSTRRELDDVFWTRDGTALPVVYTLAPLRAAGERVGAIVLFADERQRRRDAELLHARIDQQTAVAELGLRALSGAALDDLLQHASAQVAKLLDVEFSGVLELIDEQQGLRLVAGVGWRPGTVSAAHVGLDLASQAGFAVARDQPVVVDDWRRETRFRAPSLLREHGVVSGITAVIHGRDDPCGTEPWGVVGAHSASARMFTAADVSFLQSVATTLALAIERSDAERELQERSSQTAELAKQVSRLAAQRRRIAADALHAEDRTREQIAQLLHDEVLQCLLTARQDLAKSPRAGNAEDEAVTHAREAVLESIEKLRHAVAAVHPVTLAQGGLAAAIQATSAVYVERAGFQVSLDVDPQASGERDRLLVSIAQELLSNIARHAQASHATISLRRVGEDVVFEVADNGIGMHPARPGEALQQSHVGLASIAMRVEAAGGRFELSTRPGEGTRARVVLPADTLADRPSSFPFAHSGDGRADRGTARR